VSTPPLSPTPPRAPLAGERAAGRIPFRSRRAAAGCSTALLALLALAGCKLVDQTTFAPAPATAPPAAPARAVVSRAPLLTIGPGTPVSAYRSLLAFAVHAAEERDRNVRFDVTAVAPANLPPERQSEEVTAATAEATQVMQAITHAGVPPGRILLHAMLDPTAAHREVLVYVR
jgi:hypothetical protein